MSITGCDGIPNAANAPNEVRGSTTVRLSVRLSPIFDCDKAVEVITQKVTTNVPHGATVKIVGTNGGNGWCMKVLEPWLNDAITDAGHQFFNKPVGSYGDGGSIPFLKELGTKYPETQIIALGVGGPFSNMHGPNEMLELTYVKKITCALSHILAGCTTSS